MTAPPGHITNLTAEEEAKLAELWTLALRVFGVGKDGMSTLTSRTSTESTPQPAKKAGGWRIFGGGGATTEETEAETNTNANLGPDFKLGDGDDKYGLNKDFTKALAAHTPEALRNTFWDGIKNDHPDAAMLRYLRARKWDVSRALVMMVSCLGWRHDSHVDDMVLKGGEPAALRDSTDGDATAKKVGDDFMTMVRKGGSFVHSTDKDGRPVYLVRTRLHHAGRYCEKALENMIVFQLESSRLMRNPTGTSFVLFDLTNFGLTNMDYAPVKFFIKCFEANYPESLGAVVIHKAPWVFSGIWSIIKGWLDPVVASKVHFTADADALTAFIPRDQLLTELGGDLDYDHDKAYQEPDLDADFPLPDDATGRAAKAEHAAKRAAYQDLTLQWVEAKTKAETGTGTENAAAAALMDRRHELAIEMVDCYWKMDRYVRARSWYDKMGMIANGCSPGPVDIRGQGTDVLPSIGEKGDLEQSMLEYAPAPVKA